MSSAKTKKTTSKTKSKKRVAARGNDAKAEMRELIFRAARRMVLENGFANLSIRKLADKIGYAPGTIYLYFKDRDELAREICVRGFAELAEKLSPAANVADARARLAALLHAYADFAAKNPDTYRLSFMENPAFTHELMRQEPLEPEGGAGKRAFEQIVTAVGELKRAGKLARAEDENLFAEMLWAAVHGFVSLKLVYPAFPANSVADLIDKLLAATLSEMPEPKAAG